MGSGFHGSDPKSPGAMENGFFFQGGLITLLFFPKHMPLRVEF